ncbi:cupin domain-containing protein [Streptomyces sp. NPDC048257]|uniref:cupin domain-containing protein n=1 Tax=Streptomyces sp. NPDC048257 TaxID=3365526 RepID=UPI00371D0B8F
MGGQQTMTAGPGGACVAAFPHGREIVIPPGGCTGWHFHGVRLDAVVLAGTLTRVLHDRTVEVHPAGTTFVEPAGIRHIHLGHNLGTEPVVLHVTPALPEETPFSIPTAAPPGATPAVCGEHTP